MDQEKIGKFICEQRKKLNLTQSQLAEQLSVTSQAISKWENGRGIPDIEQLNKLSEVFNVDISEIINGENKTNKHHNNKKVVYLVLGILIIVVLLILFFRLDKDSFSFKTLTSDNSCFGVKGVIAYNKNKKSIYISNISCSKEQENEFLDIECILYESIDNIDKKIQEYGKIKNYEEYDINNKKTLNELLKNVEFNIDNYDCSCNKESCNDLYIRINALTIDDKIVTYNIPIELENKCIN